MPSTRACARRAAATWLACALGLASAHTARAQESATEPAAAEALKSAPAAAPLPELPGAELYRQAESRYSAGDVPGALVLMQKAYTASERPELLFNLGQLHRELHHCRQARESYERYLALAKNGTRHEQAERSRSELALECPPATPAAPARAAEPAKPYWTPARSAGFATIGGSLVLGAAAGYFALRAHHLQNELESDIRRARSTRGDYVMAYDELDREGQHAAVVARALAVTALGVAAVGFSLLVFVPGHSEGAVNTVSLRCTQHGATAVYQGSF